jgi:hypothetical protein
VRDRTVADVRVLVTQIGNGGGRDQYTVEFSGVERFGLRKDRLRFLTPPTTSAEER